MLKLSVIGALALLVVFPVFAQQMFTLDECIKVAIENSLSMKNAEGNLHAAQLAHREIEHTGLPQIKFDGTAMYAPTTGNLGYDPAITNGGQLSAQVVVQEPIFDGGARSLKQNQLSIDIARLNTEQRRTVRDVRNNVTIAFVDLLQAQHEISLQQQRVDELSDYLDLVNKLLHGGGINYTDLLKTKVNVETAQAALKKNLREYNIAKISLAEAMGIPRDTSFNIRGSLEVRDSLGADSLLQGLLADSLSNLDLQLADFAVRRSAFDIDLAHSEQLPSVSLMGDVGVLTSVDNLRLPSDQRVSMVGYSIGVSVENLFFNWGATDMRVQERQIEAENTRRSFEQQRRAVIAEAERLRYQIQNAFEQLHALNRSIGVAEDNYTLTKAQYGGGGATALDVLSAEQLLSENRFAELQIRADLRRLISRVEQLCEH